MPPILKEIVNLLLLVCGIILVTAALSIDSINKVVFSTAWGINFALNLIITLLIVIPIIVGVVLYIIRRIKKLTHPNATQPLTEEQRKRAILQQLNKSSRDKFYKKRAE